MTKSLDQILFQFYAQNDGLRITDLHQGIVWGTHTEQTRRHVQLINRFDYDGDYGTVLNRFLIQAAIGYPADRARHRRPDPRLHPHPGTRSAASSSRLSDAPEARRAGEDLQPDDRDPPRPRPRRARRRADRRQDRLAAEPAQGGGRERPRGPRTTSSSPSASTRSPCAPACSTRWSRWRRNTPTASTAPASPASPPGPRRSPSSSSATPSTAG